MKTLYEASSAVEAHMLQDLLRQEGFDARIEGAFLQGAIGELPASGLVRLVVEDHDFDGARAVIDRWEAATVSEPTARPERQRSRWLAPAVAALLIGAGGTYLFLRSAVTADGVDHNGDGVLDERWSYSPAGAPIEGTVDRNLDGKADYLMHYDRRGRIASAEGDDDFDGKFESRYRFRAGNVESSEVDTDGDGFSDMRSYFEHGVLRTTEFINPNTGWPVRTEHFSFGKLSFAEIDANNDGKMDRKLVYSAAGEVTRTEAIQASR